MHPLSSPIRRLRSALLAKVVMVDLTETTDPRISRGLDWLVSRQIPAGGFGSGGAAETAFAVLTIAQWRPDWLGSDAHRAACAYLDAKVASGEALETIWDEGITLRVLIGAPDLDQRMRSITRAAGLIARVVDDDVPPHHLAQVLFMAQDALLPTDQLVQKLIDFNVDAVGDNAYVRGQILWAKVTAALPLASWRDEERWLCDWIQKTDPTKGNFQDFCAALVGLAMTGTEESQAQIVGRVDVLFRPGLQRPTDGSWYHFAWETSWSLFALSNTSAAARVELSTPELLGLLSEADEAVDLLDTQVDQYRHDAAGSYFWTIVVTTAVLAATLTLLVVFSFGTASLTGWLSSGVGWFFGPVLPAIRVLFVAAQGLRSGETNSAWFKRFFGVDTRPTRADEH